MQSIKQKIKVGIKYRDIVFRIVYTVIGIHYTDIGNRVYLKAKHNPISFHENDFIKLFEEIK